MPVDDPRAGGAFIWLVASFLFVSVAVGGGCLLMYMVLPESDTSSSWLPILGVTLVCLPWLFWFLTFLYRILSRVSGFRVGIGRVTATGGGAAAIDHHHGNTSGDHNVDENTSCGDDDDDDHQQHPLGLTADVNPTDQVQFGAAAMMMNEQGHDDDDDDDDDHHGKINGGKYSRSSSSSSNVSHESEMPLALSMAS